MKVILTKEDCHCKLVDFYENAAKKAGVKFDDDSMFDCRRILITKMAQFEIRSYYHEQGMSEEEISITLAQYGPKALLQKTSESPYIAEIQEGFVTEYPRSNVNEH